MVPRLRSIGRRLGAAGQGFVNTFLRDNRVLPPVLALLALFVFAWIVAGAYIDEPEQERVSNQTNVAQTQDAPGSDPLAPEVENRDVDSYAAYRNKDPFRQLLTPAEDQEDTGQPASAPADETTASAEPTAPGDGGATPGGGSPDGGGRAADADGDGLSDRREAALGQDPNNPDTDGDGTPDGADDADGDGRPDGGRRGAAGGAGGSAGDGAGGGGGAGTGGGATGSAPAAGGNGAGLGGEGAAGGGRGDGGRGAGGRDDGGGRPGRDDDLLDSGGSLYAPHPLR